MDGIDLRCRVKGKPADLQLLGARPLMKKSSPEICPVCGENVPPSAKACPECGADERSGWKRDALISDALDLPDEEFDYDEFVKEEFENGKSKSRSQLLWAAVAAALLAILLALYFMDLL
jgi:predicted amidophosphoribosyltransferase